MMSVVSIKPIYSEVLKVKWQEGQDKEKENENATARGVSKLVSDANNKTNLRKV